MPLTRNDIEKAQPCINRKGEPTDKPYKVYDALGLYLLVNPNGGKWWRFKYLFGRKERQASLGCYPKVTLKQARDERNRLRHLLDNGIDPCTQLISERAAIRDEESRQLAATRFMLSNDGALSFRLGKKSLALSPLETAELRAFLEATEMLKPNGEISCR